MPIFYSVLSVPILLHADVFVLAPCCLPLLFYTCASSCLQGFDTILTLMLGCVQGFAESCYRLVIPPPIEDGFWSATQHSSTFDDLELPTQVLPCVLRCSQLSPTPHF